MVTEASFVRLPSIGVVIERSRSNGLPLSRLPRRATGTPTVHSTYFWRRRAPHLGPGRPARMAPLACSVKHPDHYTELRDAADFESIVTPVGYLSLCGFGSLLSERSARSTFPDLRNFRMAVLRGFRRVFAHVTPVFFERGIANEETKEVSCLSVEPCEGESLVITVFDITTSEVPSFIKREHEFRFLAVVPEALDGTPYNNSAVVCARYSDEEYFQIRCKGDVRIFYQHYGKYNIHKIWRDDILPCRLYLRHCVLAAKNLGEAAYDNFLDHTFLNDRKTTIREYLAGPGAGIMEEEPPHVLRSRYGG